jgi:hypothetical protein
MSIKVELKLKYPLLTFKQAQTHVLKFGLDGLRLSHGYSFSGDLVDVHYMFDEILLKSLSLWTTMICGYMLRTILCFWGDMVVVGFEPNGATLVSVLSGCLELREMVHEFMRAKGVEVVAILATTLVYMYAKNEVILLSRKLFDETTERNVATWNVMICV